MQPAFTFVITKQIARYIILGCLLAWGVPVFAGIHFTNISTHDGLSSNLAYSIIQDRHGFIWIGTQDGLNRYDGFRMISFLADGSPSGLSSSNISTLLEDGERLWVGTYDGLNTIDIRNFEVEQVNTGSARVIRALHKDSVGRIWIGTTAGLLIYNENAGYYTFFNTLNSALTHNTIRCFYEASNGDMWIGTYNGLNRFRDGSFTGYDLKGAYKPMLDNNLILDIVPVNDNSDAFLWVGTETGLAHFNTVTGAYTLFNTSNTTLSNEVIKCIYRHSDSVLWLGTDFGLNVFNTVTLNIETYYHDPLIEHTVASNVIWEIVEDNQQGLWLITSNGVSLTEKRKAMYAFHEVFFSYDNPRIGNQVKDVLVASSGDIWLATIHGVVKENLDDGERKTFSIASSINERILLNNVYALAEDDEGRIWIGTAGGINIWDPRTANMHSITAKAENGLLSNYISGFATDCEGNMWVTAWEGGLFRMEWRGPEPEDISFRMADKNGDGRLIALPGWIFYGYNNSFWQIDGRNLQKKPVHKVNKALGGKHISAMLAGSDGSVWIGSTQKVIRYFPETDSLITVPVMTGKPQMLINLIEDHQGNLWASTFDAVIRIKSDKAEQIFVPIKRHTPLKGFYNHCAAITPQGHLLFGGNNGYVRIVPETVETGTEIPQVFISGLSVNNQQILPPDTMNILENDIAFTNKLRLTHNQNSITFEFTSHDYFFAEFVKFQYRMLPLNEEWVHVSGDRNYAVFANLNPGTYAFEVRGSNRHGMWSDTKLLNITIAPSIWMSKGFITMYALLAIAIPWYAYSVYNNRRRLRNELQIMKLEKQHSEALYHAKIRFFTNISHEFRTPLSLIIPPIQELMKGSVKPEHQNRLLTLASRNAQRLYKLVNQVLDFRKIENEKLELTTSRIEMVSFCRRIFDSFDDLASRHEIAYQFKTNHKTIYSTADGDKLETIVFNLLSNAFKYTPVHGNISMNLLYIQNENEGDAMVRISVKDSGIGISGEEQKHIFEQFYQTSESKALNKGSGIGLTLAQEYAKLHRGSISVTSDKGKGSEFVLNLPADHQRKYVGRLPVKIQHDYKAGAIQNTMMSLPPTAKRILVVDDNEDILEYIQMNLCDFYHIHLAANGQEALELLKKQHVHLIISDVMMPIMDGIALCSRIKQSRTLMHIPVILLTARSLETQKVKGLDSGADLYITKPFDIEYLKSSIRSIFKREEQMTEYIRTQLLINPKNDADEKERNEDALFLKKVMTLIENNISNPDFGVEMLSRLVNMSSTHLYRKLKAITGLPTKEVIMNYRMQKAAKMIKNSEGNISDIMYAVGFANLSGFSRSFKAKFGVPPTGFKA